MKEFVMVTLVFCILTIISLHFTQQTRWFEINLRMLIVEVLIVSGGGIWLFADSSLEKTTVMFLVVMITVLVSGCDTYFNFLPKRFWRKLGYFYDVAGSILMVALMIKLGSFY